MPCCGGTPCSRQARLGEARCTGELLAHLPLLQSEGLKELWRLAPDVQATVSKALARFDALPCEKATSSRRSSTSPAKNGGSARGVFNALAIADLCSSTVQLITELELMSSAD
jgi:hypothetical protein